jgi:hypothetical protein
MVIEHSFIHMKGNKPWHLPLTSHKIQVCNCSPKIRNLLEINEEKIFSWIWVHKGFWTRTQKVPTTKEKILGWTKLKWQSLFIKRCHWKCKTNHRVGKDMWMHIYNQELAEYTKNCKSIRRIINLIEKWAWISITTVKRKGYPNE